MRAALAKGHKVSYQGPPAAARFAVARARARAVLLFKGRVTDVESEVEKLSGRGMRRRLLRSTTGGEPAAGNGPDRPGTSAGPSWTSRQDLGGAAGPGPRVGCGPAAGARCRSRVVPRQAQRRKSGRSISPGSESGLITGGHVVPDGSEPRGGVVHVGRDLARGHRCSGDRDGRDGARHGTGHGVLGPVGAGAVPGAEEALGAAERAPGAGTGPAAAPRRTRRR